MHRTRHIGILPLALGLAYLAIGAEAQSVDSNMLLHPSKDSWPAFHGDYSGRRHVALTQINPSNVADITLAWTFQTGNATMIKATPILVDGVLYLTQPDNIYAIDARTAHLIWHYTAQPNRAFHIGQRGVSIYKDKIYYESTDAHALALDAKTGKVVWDVVVADSDKGQWGTMAPLIVGNHVIVGASGDFDNLRGFIRALDPDTGATQWNWYSTDPVGTRGKTSGGNVWLTGTYDPDLNLMFWGTGNPTPVLTGSTRPGNDLYTCSIVALNPDTGKLAWAFQPSPHDTHDWDAVEIPVLADVAFQAENRKVLMQASRNGYFFVVDRTTGKALVTEPFGPVNWSLGVDKEGRPLPNPEKEPAADGRLIAPDEGGMTNYRQPSFDPKTGLFIVSASPSYSVYFSKPADGNYGWSGADYSVWSKGALEAIDYRTGKVKWSYDIGRRGTSGVMTTDSGLTFSGDSSGNFLALDTATGKTLWHAGTGAGVGAAPISYELDGKQVVLMSSGGVLYAWTLPDDRISSAPKSN